NVGQNLGAGGRFEPDRRIRAGRVAGEIVLIDAAGAAVCLLRGEIQDLVDGIDRDAGNDAERGGEVVVVGRSVVGRDRQPGQGAAGGADVGVDVKTVVVDDGGDVASAVAGTREGAGRVIAEEIGGIVRGIESHPVDERSVRTDVRGRGERHQPGAVEI